MQTQRISQALTDERNGQRPIYMVLRHLGVEPRVAVDALFGAGLRPNQYSALCSTLTTEQAKKIAALCGEGRA